MKYKFINFKETGKEAGRAVFTCYNNRTKDTLGGVTYYAPWRQYVFYATEGALFNHSCLSDIMDFLKRQK